MIIKRRFIAGNSKQAMYMVQNTLGSNAVIFSNRRVPEGVEIIAGLEEAIPVAASFENKTTTPSEALAVHHENSALPSYDFLKQEPDSEELKKMQQEIALLRSLLEGQVVQSLSQKLQTGDAKQTMIKERLLSLGVDAELAMQLTTGFPSSLTVIDAWKQVQEKLQSLILTTKQEIIDEHKIVALVGATGVGKTTTLAKLATRFVLKHHPEELALITTDFNRVAAQGQLLLYGQILGVETLTVHREEDLRQILLNLNHKRLILIDTAGVSQRDNINIARLFSVFNHQKNLIQAYLALSCTSQSVVLEETVQAFQSVNLSGCIFTKADEVPSLVPAISVAIKHQLPIAYITHGQRIPQDIRMAEASELARLILNLTPNTQNTRQFSRSPLDLLAEESS